jgi:hypothetical protein
MARRTSTTNAADEAESPPETQIAPAAETATDGERIVTDAGTSEQFAEQVTQTPDPAENPTDVEQPQAPEHPETGEGNQAGSATGEETEQGAEKGESDKGAVSAEGEGATTTHLEAVQRSGDLSDASGEIPAGSTGTRNPDPELANNLGQNEKAVAREAQRLQDVQSGSDRRSARKMMNDKSALEDLNVELRDAEARVAEAVRERDELRTEHDRLTDRIMAAGSTPFGEITSSYFAASDKLAAEEAEQRKKLSAIGLGALLSGRTA